MSSVTFSHTKTQEREYLNELFKEEAWFRREQFNVFMPSSKMDIKEQISKSSKNLKRKADQLKRSWREIEADYFKVVKNLHHKKLRRIYRCHISQYGPEGKYQHPNQLFVRFRTKRDEKRAVETIGHELLHLAFADFFEAKQLNYFEREGVIDALIIQSSLADIFPEYEKQSIGKDRPELLRSIVEKN